MTRILVHVEGQTEEEFVNSILAPHLYNKGFTQVSARLIGMPRVRKRRGGTCSWESAHQGIARHLNEDQKVFATTLIDYYALPATGSNCWPGRETCSNHSVYEKSERIQSCLRQDFSDTYDEDLARRFIPFVAMYEFEGLLFSDPTLMAQGMGESSKAGAFHEIRNQFDTPEHINDSPQTAPSKRIQSVIPGYNKVLQGNLAAMDVTLGRIRAECSLFDDWVSNLETLGTSSC